MLQWLADGKNARGTALRGPDETPTRLDALRFYTSGSAWVSHDEQQRGSLEVGKLADVAVLSQDILAVPPDAVKDTKAMMTVVGGKIMYRQGL